MCLCALCGENSELRQSHILPELLHRPLYDHKHRTVMFEFGAQEGLILQRGLRERLLCDSCEKRLHVYEDYFDKRWKSALPDPIPEQLFNVMIDYRRTKLFVLSVMWRASVSKLAAYRHYSLGPHEAAIRRLLLNDNPGPKSLYPVMGGVIITPDGGPIADGLLLSPVKMKIDGHWATRMVFAGVAWSVFTTSHRLKEGFYGLMLDESCTMPLFGTRLDKVSTTMGLHEAVANLRWPLSPEQRHRADGAS